MTKWLMNFGLWMATALAVLFGLFGFFWLAISFILWEWNLFPAALARGIWLVSFLWALAMADSK